MELKSFSQASGGVGYYVRWAEGTATVVQAGTEVRVEWLWIRPELRKQGLGRRMLAEIKRHFSLPIRPITVLEAALPFWNQMAREGLAIEPDDVY